LVMTVTETFGTAGSVQRALALDFRLWALGQ